MNILGLNFFHPNAAAALFAEGELVAAAEEERYNRVKFSAGIPLSANAFCLEKANLNRFVSRRGPRIQSLGDFNRERPLHSPSRVLLRVSV